MTYCTGVHVFLSCFSNRRNCFVSFTMRLRVTLVVGSFVPRVDLREESRVCKDVFVYLLFPQALFFTWNLFSALFILTSTERHQTG